MQTMTFGQWIKKLRAQQDLTQEMLSERVGCATPTLRSFEIGARRPSREMAERIADVLQVPADQRNEFLQLARLPVDVVSKNGPQRATNIPVAPSPGAANQSSLPPLSGLFIGREAEQNALQQLLLEDRQRLITLLGAGGIGKTRLALEVAHRLVDRFRHGVVFMALAPLQSTQHLASALIAAASIPTQGSQLLEEVVADWLLDKELLVVLDNFEHLISDPAAITWVRDLLQRAAGVQLLITSRERLRISGERTFELGGLGQSSNSGEFIDKADATLLFLARAEQVAGDFVLDASNRAAVARICKLVEGMPLAIELAAAWVRTLSPQEIADELTRNLDFLTLADRDTAPRHRSMRAVFDHSWRLLSDEEQQVLMKLSLFRGGCTRQAAAVVANASLPVLASLIDKSLLYRTSGEPDRNLGNKSQARYFLHELVNQYAAEYLQNQPFAAEIWDQFATYFVQLVEAIAPQLYTDESLSWRRQIAVEQDNLRAILQSSLTERKNPDLGLRLVAVMGRYWCATDLWKEGRDWIERALALSKAEGVVRSRALTALGELYHLLGDQPKAEKILLEALTYWREQKNQEYVGWTLLQLGKATSTRAAYDEADIYLSESLEIYRQLGNQHRIATLLNQLSAVAIQRGDYVRAEALLNESLPGVRASNSLRQLAIALNFLGRAILGQKDTWRALPLFHEALEIFESEEAEPGIAWSLLNLGLAERELGNFVKATEYYRRCFQTYQHLEQIGGMMAACEGLASVWVELGNFEASVTLLAAAQRLHQQSGQALTLYEIEIQTRTLTRTRSALTEQVWKQAWHSGAALSIPQLMTLVESIRA